MNKRYVSLFASAICVIALTAGDTPGIGAAPQHQTRSPALSGAVVWEEIKWPFLMDQWGTGRAFRCRPADCGTELQIYVRPKIGFCNCTTGVADDDEIDRIGDVELIGSGFSGMEPGTGVTIAGMKGRARWYRVADGRIAKFVLAIAFAKKCDVMVATAVAREGWGSARESAVYEFLNGDVVMQWAARELGT